MIVKINYVKKVKYLRLIIIYEISMFHQIDHRLRVIFVPFGGILVIVFGELRQLRLVGDKYVFHTNPDNVLSNWLKTGCGKGSNILNQWK